MRFDVRCADLPRAIIVVAVCAALLPASAPADVKLPAVIASHMVLQRETTVPLWGWAAPGEHVRVKPDWAAEEAADADASGAWRVRLQTPAAGGPHQITITGNNTIALDDILVGEVWVCSGQSNMEWSVGPVVGPGVENFAEVLKSADQPQIRLFDVKNAIALEPATDCTGTWAVCSPQTLPPFSAVGYFFGRALEKELNVPIGLIATNWGGTPAEAWTSEAGLRGVPELMARYGDELTLVERQRTHPDQVRAEQAEAAAKWWIQIDAADEPATTAGWMKPDFDDTAWETMTQPAAWGGDLAKFDGIVWFRRTVEIPAAAAGHDLSLELGPIDDVDDTFFDGTRVGGLHAPEDWTTPRRYTIPATAATTGRHVLAVRVLDTGGPGGMNGKPEQMRLISTTQDAGSAVTIAGPWRFHVGPAMAKLPPRPRTARVGPFTSTTLYNGMIAPLTPFGIRGAIWYQGESNRGDARLYRTLFPAMIADWRRNWGQGDFPFYYVQIAPYIYDGDQGESAEVREAQMLTLRTPNTGMAVTMDIGNPRNIHPGHKDEAGRRLALWALAKTYGRPNLVVSGPLYKSMTVDGNRIRLTFEYVGGGLVARGGGPLTHFVIAGEDRKFLPATAEIDGDTVVVSSPAVAHPVAVRFAWGTADEPNLSNADGLPASSFRTDDWQGVLVTP